MRWNTVCLTAMVIIGLGCAGPLRSMPTPTTIPTSEGFEQVLNSWIGAEGKELVATWGPPDTTFDLPGGGVVWSYRSLTQYTNPVRSKTVYYEVSNTYETTYSGGELVTEYCNVDFELSDKNSVLRWRHEGNECLAVPEPKPFECLGHGGAYRVSSVGTLSGETDSPDDDFVGVELSDGSVWRVIPRTGDARPFRFRTGGRVGVCLESGIGTYLFAFPEQHIVRADRAL